MSHSFLSPNLVGTEKIILTRNDLRFLTFHLKSETQGVLCHGKEKNPDQSNKQTKPTEKQQPKSTPKFCLSK